MPFSTSILLFLYSLLCLELISHLFSSINFLSNLIYCALSTPGSFWIWNELAIFFVLVYIIIFLPFIFLNSWFDRRALRIKDSFVLVILSDFDLNNEHADYIYLIALVCILMNTAVSSFCRYKFVRRINS